MAMLGDWAAFFALAGAVFFTVGYGTLAPWWRSPIGRNMFLFSVSHVALFTLVVLALTLGLDWAGRPWVRLAVYLMIGLLFWQRAFILVTDQMLASRDAREARRYGADRRACRECGK
jgi:hypothetical protein